LLGVYLLRRWYEPKYISECNDVSSYGKDDAQKTNFIFLAFGTFATIYSFCKAAKERVLALCGTGDMWGREVL
jgi:hypothetical protein